MGDGSEIKNFKIFCICRN